MYLEEYGYEGPQCPSVTGCGAGTFRGDGLGAASVAPGGTLPRGPMRSTPMSSQPVESCSADHLRAIAAPTMLIIDDHDFVRIDHAAEMLDLIPDAALAVFPGTTHADVMRRPDLLLAVLATFLGGPG
ncbi:MAG: mhpC [Acidimicrobiales bacterium]|nr:mhpC [Acidimicrobiales bacterium]